MTKPLLFASADECEQAFYDALEAGDAEAVNELWLDEDEVCCIHPGGPRMVGAATVRAGWTSMLANGPIRVRATQRRAVETPSVALSSVVEEIIMMVGDRQRVAHVMATNAFVKTPSGWKMVLHHASPAQEGPAHDVSAPMGPLH